LASDSILVVMALPLESGGAFENLGVPVLYTGVGKLNAAHALTRELLRGSLQTGRDIRLVLNLGTAGSSVFATGALVECTRFVQRDMDASPLGFAIGETPYDGHPPVLEHAARFAQLPQAACGSGDSFCLGYDTAQFQVVDMEAYALAKVCRMEGLSFASVKFISDGAKDAESAGQWQQHSRSAGESLAQFFHAFALA
jgi:adenosylhomocysteine nucleosidase